MIHEEKVQVGGIAATIGFDDTDGMKEFLSRTKFKSKIDQVIDFYGIPYCWKNDINKFFPYNIQDRHIPIVHDHFYGVLRSNGYSVEDFDYKKMQDEYILKYGNKGIGLDVKVNLHDFQKQIAEQSTQVVQPQLSQDIINSMKGMLDEIKELKADFLSIKNKSDVNTTRKSEVEKKTKPGTKKNPGHERTVTGEDVRA